MLGVESPTVEGALASLVAQRHVVGEAGGESEEGTDEAIYLASLIRHGSPAIEWMHSQKRPAPIEEEPLT